MKPLRPESSNPLQNSWYQSERTLGLFLAYSTSYAGKETIYRGFLANLRRRQLWAGSVHHDGVVAGAEPEFTIKVDETGEYRSETMSAVTDGAMPGDTVRKRKFQGLSFIG